MKRPGILTFCCVLGYLSVIVTFPQVFSPSVKKLGLFMPALYGLLVAGEFMAYIGIWFMKRWGTELFLILYFVRTLLDLLLGNTGFGFYLGQVFSIFFTFFLLRNYRFQDNNL